jgi:NTE family protein
MDQKNIGLALSGGGYRATIYHLGTFKKLKELNLLDKIGVISTNSGGSIIGAAYGIYGSDFDNFERVIKKTVNTSIIKSVLTSFVFISFTICSVILLLAIFYFLFTSYAWLSLVIFISSITVLLRFQYNILPISKINERIFNKILFKNKSLSDLSKDLDIVINATNAETGTLFTFSRDKMTDSSYSHPNDNGKPIIFKHKEFPIAKAVAASTCVPFVFSPIRIDKKFYVFEKDIKRAKPRLIDGGVYDNQGVHKIAWPNSTYKKEILIISDAGNEIPFKNSYKNVFTLLIRSSDIFMNRIKNLQMIKLIFNSSEKKQIAYQSLGWSPEKSIPKFIENIKNGFISDQVIAAHDIKKSDIEKKEWKKIEKEIYTKIDYNKIVENANSKLENEIARNVKTNLTALKKNQIDTLINHASVMTELQIKLYCPSLLN